MAVALRVKKWTLAEVHRLPDDGNKYELVRGELFVTPPPGDEHETIAAKLSVILTPYVHANRLGYVYHPKAVMRFKGSEVEPDLMVRRPHPNRKGNDRDWNTAPIPILIVEILSPFTRRRDQTDKRQLYLDAGIDEYWMVDSEERCIVVVRRGQPDTIARDDVTWMPRAGSSPLTFAVQDVFETP